MINKKIFTSISLIIPIYNNEKTAEKLLNQCEAIIKKTTKEYEILIIDDKSTDQTVNLLRERFINKNNYHIIFHRENKGIASTIRSLYRKAKKDYIVLFSVDGDWNPNDINNMLKTMIKRKADIIIGVRSKANYKINRKIISFFYNFLPQLFFHVKTYDAGSIKVIRRKIINNISIQSKSVFFEAEIIIKAFKKGAIIAPCHISYKKTKDSHGAGGNWKLVFDSLKDIIKLRINTL